MELTYKDVWKYVFQRLPKPVGREFGFFESRSPAGCDKRAALVIAHLGEPQEGFNVVYLFWRSSKRQNPVRRLELDRVEDRGGLVKIRSIRMVGDNAVVEYGSGWVKRRMVDLETGKEVINQSGQLVPV